MSEEEIKDQLRTEEKYEILQVYRFHRKHYFEGGEIQYLPTQTVKVTFKAQHLPKRAYTYFTTSEIEAYNIPILQCRKCQKYGHYAKYCQNATICEKCAEEHQISECKSQLIKCANCKLPHRANSSSCTMYQTQDQIRRKMQELKISYREARDILQGNKSYAQIVLAKQQTSVFQQPLNQTRQRVIPRESQFVHQDKIPVKRRIIDSSQELHQKDLQRKIDQNLINPHGRLQKSTAKSVTYQESKANSNIINKRRETNVGLQIPHKSTLDNTINTPSERIIIQKFNNLIQEAPEYLRHEIEQLKLEILPLTKQYKKKDSK